MARSACYISAEVLGALAASGLLKFLFPAIVRLGATILAGAVAQSFVRKTSSALCLCVAQQGGGDDDHASHVVRQRHNSESNSD